MIYKLLLISVTISAMYMSIGNVGTKLPINAKIIIVAPSSHTNSVCGTIWPNKTLSRPHRRYSLLPPACDNMRINIGEVPEVTVDLRTLARSTWTHDPFQFLSLDIILLFETGKHPMFEMSGSYHYYCAVVKNGKTIPQFIGNGSRNNKRIKCEGSIRINGI